MSKGVKELFPYTNAGIILAFWADYREKRLIEKKLAYLEGRNPKLIEIKTDIGKVIKGLTRPPLAEVLAQLGMKVNTY